MAANTSPIFTNIPKISWTTALTTASNTYDGTTSPVLLFTADATDGSFVQYVNGKALGTNIASNVRIFINNGSTTGTAANNILFYEQSLPATTAVTAAGTVNLQIPLNIQLPPAYTLQCVISTTVAAGWKFCAVGGDY